MNNFVYLNAKVSSRLGAILFGMGKDSEDSEISKANLYFFVFTELILDYI